MCGICGVVQVSGPPRLPVVEDALDRMTDIMAHRGPNDRGTLLAPGIALGARRLSIVDLDGGHQPVANEDGRVHAAQNGEIYNHAALRAELERSGHTFRSRCDTDVLPHIYEEEGPAFVRRLRGMFGLAVWDERKRRAVVARDRLGIKPMYYAEVGDLLVFGSELKSVLASGLVDPELDYDALDAFMSLGFIPGPRTPLRSVRKLMPGEQLVVADGRVERERYWVFPAPVSDSSRNEAEWAESLLAELEESVRLRLMADVPLGAMLSGGLDSSLIVALMTRATSQPVKTFSIGFAETGEDNELAVARQVAALFGAEHHEIELSLADDRVDLVELSWHMDEPLADLSALGFLALCRLAADSVTVALSGQGADELLGGYSRHRNARLAAQLSKLPRPFAGAIRLAAGRSSRLSSVAAVLRAEDPAQRQLGAFAHLRRDIAPALEGGELGSRGGRAALDDVQARLSGMTDSHPDPLASMLYLDGQLGLVDDMLHYFDRTSMAHSLEVRVPFLDHKLVEFCARIPTELKVKGLTTKYVLKRAAAGVLPEDIVDRRKVGFFNAAADGWLRGQRDVIADYLLGEDPAYTAFARRDEVEQLVRRQAAGELDGRALLPLLMLEIWLTEYLPRAVGASVPAGVAA